MRKFFALLVVVGSLVAVPGAAGGYMAANETDHFRCLRYVAIDVGDPASKNTAFAAHLRRDSQTRVSTEDFTVSIRGLRARVVTGPNPVYVRGNTCSGRAIG